jgi:transposase
MTSEAVFVGIDVAQAEVVVAVRPSGENWTVATTDTAVATLVSRLQADPPALIVLEATGKLEVPIASALVAAALPVAIVNPRQVRDFAKATGQLAKTDTLDAHVLAHFAEAIRPPPRPLPDQTTQALRDLIHRRRQLGAMLTAERNRLARASERLRPQLTEHIAWLHARITDLDAELTQILRESPAWRAHEKLLRTVPGVGPVVARTVLALLHEIQTAAHRPLAKLVGVAPLNHDSGTRRGKRTTWGGRGPQEWTGRDLSGQRGDTEGAPVHNHVTPTTRSRGGEDADHVRPRWHSIPAGDESAPGPIGRSARERGARQ